MWFIWIMWVIVALAITATIILLTGKGSMLVFWILTLKMPPKNVRNTIRKR